MSRKMRIFARENRMKTRLRQFVLFVCLLVIPLGTLAEMNNGDSLRVSLITCSPGQEIYEYYGHTALRIKDMKNGDDVVFNFGLFSFQTPHFVWRFVCGKTDYMVGAIPTSAFLPEYSARGSFVEEDVLNLTQDEAKALLSSLASKCEEDSWSYHYDFFYDNCATRVRDEIQNCLKGRELMWSTFEEQRTLREIVHEYSQNYAWSLFAQDLLLGAEADRPATRLAQQFAPIIMERELRTAILRDSSGMKPLLKEQDMLVEQRSVPLEKGFPLSPMTCFIILLCVTVVVTGWDFYHLRATWIFDAILLSLQGLIGLLITFMFFFSLHPTVDSNWLILLFNPLPLVFLYWTQKAERAGCKSIYHEVARFYLFLFILMSALHVIPQYIGNEVLILAFCLLLRSMSYCNLTIRLKRKNKETA